MLSCHFGRECVQLVQVFPVGPPDLLLDQGHDPLSQCVIASRNEPLRIIPEEFMLLNIKANRSWTFGECLLTAHYIHDLKERLYIREQLGVQSHCV